MPVNNINNLKCDIIEMEAKQLRLVDDLEADKEEFRRRLLNMSQFIDNTIKKHKLAHRELANNYITLWDKHERMTCKINNLKKFEECLNRETDAMSKMCEQTKCQLVESQKRNQCLEEEHNELKRRQLDVKNIVDCLEFQNFGEKQFQETMCDKLNVVTLELDKNSKKLASVKKQNCDLKMKLKLLKNETLWKAQEWGIKEFQLAKQNNDLQVDLEAQKYRQSELNCIVHAREIQLRKLTHLINKTNKEIEQLIKAMEEDRIQSEVVIDQLRSKNRHAEDEKTVLENKFKISVEELNNEQRENKFIISQVNQLESQLNIAMCNRDEINKLMTEQMKKVNDDLSIIRADISEKCQIIIDLEKRLSEAKIVYGSEAENVCAK